MSFLAGIGAKIVEIIFGDLTAWIQKQYAAYQAKKAIQNAANQSLDALNKAKTGAEIDSASDDALNNL